MERILVFLFVCLAMVATSFWESHVEGPNTWDKKKYGWKLKLGKYSLPAYHFWLWIVTFPILIVLLPQVIVGFSWKFTAFLSGTYMFGSVLEDFIYYVVNPFFGLKKWNRRIVTYFPWFKVGRVCVPTNYIFGILFSALLIWLSL